jgi:uncharacterized protein
MSPRIWLMVGDRIGDNRQVETLVEALGIPVERKYVRVKAPWIKGKPKVVPSLHHIDLEASAPLEPPWPDLIVTVGRRMTLVALWVRQQSGGRTRIALIGKPSCAIEPFALIIVSGEVQIAPAPNILKIGLPLLRVDRARVAAESDAWRTRIGVLPRPLVAFLVGGPTNPFAFTRGVEREILRLAGDVAGRGGTPYLTTSPRTPNRTVRALREGWPAGAGFFEWRRDATDNPYHALLGLADGFIVTGDSLSMQVEVAALGKPLAILPLPYSTLHRLDQFRRGGARWLYDERADAAGAWSRRLILRAAGGIGLLPRTRDFSAIHELLLERGLAVRAGEPLEAPTGAFPDDLERAAGRVRALLKEIESAAA